MENKEIRMIEDVVKITDKLEAQVKRGKASFDYFVISYASLSTFSAVVVSVLEIRWFYKVALIFIIAFFLFYLCFFNNRFRNKIVGIMSKSQDKIEKY